MTSIRKRTGRITVAAVGFATLVAGVAALPVAARAAPASADVGVTLSRTPNLVDAGGLVTYTATVTNAGPDTASGAVLLDPVSRFGVVEDPITTTAGTCQPGADSGIVSCALGDIASGATVTVTIPIDVYAPGIVVNTVAIGAVTDDPNATNDQASVSVAVQPGPPYAERLTTGYFNLLLRRAPTKAELATWSDRFNRLGTNGTLPLLTATNSYRLRWIDDQFRRYLGRSAGTGPSFYLRWLNSGRSYDEVTASIVSSKEFAKSVTSYCTPTVCVDFDPSAWMAKAYNAITGDALPTALRDKLMAQYGGSPRYAIAALFVHSTQGRRKLVDFTLRKWTHQPALPIQLSFGVRDLMRGTVTAEAYEASVLSSYTVYGPFVQGCCFGYYPGVIDGSGASKR